MLRRYTCRPSPLLLFLILIGMLGCTESDVPSFLELTGPYLGQEPPGEEPVLFAPGIVSTELYVRDVAMTPDGNEMYFGLLHGSSGISTILYSRLIENRWSPLEIAPFARHPEIKDLEAAITPDGQKMMFLSNRPKEGQEFREGWVYQDIWVVDREGDSWGEPYNLGPPVNSDAAEYFPSVTRDGTIYFTRQDPSDRSSVIFRARMMDGQYADAERLEPNVNAFSNQYNAFIAPDESYLITCSTGDTGAQGRYFVTFRNEADEWSGPIDMGEKVNALGTSGYSPYVSPDGKYFFFMSMRAPSSADLFGDQKTYEAIRQMNGSLNNGNSNIYWVDASFIEKLRPE